MHLLPFALLPKNLLSPRMRILSFGRTESWAGVLTVRGTHDLTVVVKTLGDHAKARWVLVFGCSYATMDLAIPCVPRAVSPTYDSIEFD